MKPDMNIVGKILKNVTFYCDELDPSIIYAEYEKNDHTLHFQNIDSNEFSSCLRIWYGKESGSNDEVDVKPILRYIHDDSNYYQDFPAIQTHTRIAGNLRDGIEYFLADKARQVVSIKDGTWDITTESEHKFLSSASHSAQRIPERSKGKNILTLLGPFANLKDDDLTLFVIWLIQTFSGGSHYGIMFSAERGSGKSTLNRIIDRLLDPSNTEPKIMSKGLDNFQMMLANCYLASFDNVRDISIDQSDTLCSAITGGTVVKRVLYETSKVAELRLHNVVVINGIDVFPSESDLAERFLLFPLKKIKPNKINTDHDLFAEFEKVRPAILGCIFDILASATEIIKTLTPKEPTRMANAYTEMLAIANVLGISEEKFHEMITANITRLHQTCCSTPLVEAICEYMNGPMAGSRKLCDTSTNVFTRIRNNYSGSKQLLPSTASRFSRRLKAEHEALYQAGFSSIVDDTGASASTITILRER